MWNLSHNQGVLGSSPSGTTSIKIRILTNSDFYFVIQILRAYNLIDHFCFKRKTGIISIIAVR